MAETRVSREQLYELVWSRPVTHVARELGISNVGLAKVCARLGVPRPGRGYWARKAQGQKVRRARLPPCPPDTPSDAVITFREPAAPVAPEAIPVVRVPKQLTNPHPTTAKLALALESLSIDKYGMLTVYGSSATTFRASPGTKKRALRILDAFIKALERQRWTIELGDNPRGYAAGHQNLECMDRTGIRVDLGVTENAARRPHVSQDRKRGMGYTTWARKYDYAPSGKLCLRVGSRYGGQDFRDGKRPIEEQLGKALLAIEGTRERLAQARAEREEAATREQERRRAEHERERKRQLHMKAVEQLDALVDAWTRARAYRSFAEEARAVAASGLELGPLESWVAFAEEVAAEIDPLVPNDTMRARGAPNAG